MANTFITVGEKFPEFNKKSVVSIEKGKEFKDVSNKDIDGK
ncbi:MAG: alkyl hydroperoxide reductase, partial [Flavipsychrobacter sp.]|nr:alkyl hydroperoxide reductase [Flavipsychrobacter sp.]